MAQTSPAGVTALLLDWRQGRAEALDELTPIVYDELRRLARRQLRREQGRGVLQTTALVHEAYLRLVDAEVDWQDRLHFFAIVSKLMRRVLVDESRRRRAEKRGGGAPELTLEGPGGSESELDRAPGRPPDLLALDDALWSLERLDPRKGQVVELRFFAGLTIEETAAYLGISHATVERDLKVAKAWLAREMSREPGTAAAPPAD